MNAFTFNTTAQILFEPGGAARLGEIAAGRGWRRALVVTDEGLVRAGVVEPALASLRGSGLEPALFDRVVADPPEAVVQAGVDAARGHGADAVIGLGGGSSLDVAKLIALIARSGERLGEVYGIGFVRGPRLPLLLAPTTAGTGSEVTPISIVTTGAHEKKGVVSPWLIPDVALLDPRLTLGLPPAVTAATGIDAMVHAIEAFASKSPNNNPVSRALAREALRLLGANIARAVHHGSDEDARGRMLLGSLLAGQAFANSPVAAVHALAYPLGGHFGIPHGLSNALVLPHVLRFNASHAGDAYATLLGDAFPSLAGPRGEEGAKAFAEALARLSLDLGLPPRLRDAGVPESAVPALAEDAMKQARLLVNNPREVTLADARAIYEAAW